MEDLENEVIDIDNYNSQNYEKLHDEPEIYTISNFVSSLECQHMISISKDSMQKSLVSYEKGGDLSSGRTSSNTWIKHNHDDITISIANKIAKQVGIPIENAEAFQVVKYEHGQEYKNHCDSWNHNYSEKTLRCMKYGGARLKTALVYLNDVEDGGATRFSKLDISVSPKMGKLLVFANTFPGTNESNILSEHAGMPVIKGEKYIFNLWFRECDRKILYETFNPEYYKNQPQSKQSIEEQKELSKLNNVANVEIENKKESLASKFQLESIQENIFLKEKYISFEDCYNIVKNCSFDNKDQRFQNCWLKKDNFPELIQKLETSLSIDRGFLKI